MWTTKTLTKGQVASDNLGNESRIAKQIYFYSHFIVLSIVAKSDYRFLYLSTSFIE